MFLEDIAMKKFVLLISLIFLPILSLSQGVVINEVCSSNIDLLEDFDGDTPDWIELYNTSHESMNLKGFYLSDDIQDLEKWMLPDISIAPYSFLLIFASDKDTVVTDGTVYEYHTNFKISSSGEKIILADNNGQIVSEIDCPDLLGDISFGRFPDGSKKLMKFEKPTPNEKNIRIPEHGIVFSHEAGFYDKPFYLELEHSIDDTIYYTLNGETPSRKSLRYTEPIFIDYSDKISNKFCNIPTTADTTALTFRYWIEPEVNIAKARILQTIIYSSNKENSPKRYTKSYFVRKENERKYTTPVISITTDSLNLFSDETGIYVPGNKFTGNPKYSGNYLGKGKDWERPIYIEYFDENRNLQFSQKAGVRIHGKSTRMFAQKSLKIYARDKYGEKYFRYPILPERKINKYKRFILRSTMTDWGDETMLSDVIAADAVRGLDFEYMEWKPAVVFINGEYWGIHTIRDQVGAKYIQELTGIDDDSVYCEEFLPEFFPDEFEFVKNNDFTSKEKYDELSKMFDIHSAIDYFIAMIFSANVDWPVQNIMAWTTIDKSKPIRFIYYDLDAGYYYTPTNMFEHATNTDTTVKWPNAPWSTELFRKLIQNNDFKKEFIYRFLIALETHYTTENLMPRLEYIISQYEPETEEHYYRWNFPCFGDEWHERIDRQHRNFIKERPQIVYNQLKEFFDLSDEDIKWYLMNKKDMEKNFRICPNPSFGDFLVYSDSDSTFSCDIKIHDITGKLVEEIKDYQMLKQRINYICMLDLPIGPYFVTIKNKEFTEHHKLIIVR